MTKARLVQLTLAALMLGAGVLAAQSASAVCAGDNHCASSKSYPYIGDVCGGHVSADADGLGVNLGVNYGPFWSCMEAQGFNSARQAISYCYREDHTNDGESVYGQYGCHDAVRVDIHGIYN